MNQKADVPKELNAKQIKSWQVRYQKVPWFVMSSPEKGSIIPRQCGKGRPKARDPLQSFQNPRHHLKSVNTGQKVE
ncbi:hypothetical protein LguiB_021504 [Lonicera macranthoides]